MTTRVVEVSTLWTCLGVVSDPGRGINGEDEWMVTVQRGANEGSNTLDVERALGQCRVQAAMTALKGPLQAQVRKAGDQSGDGDGIEEIE